MEHVNAQAKSEQEYIPELCNDWITPPEKNRRKEQIIKDEVT